MKKDTANSILKKVVQDYSKISKEFSKTRQSGWNEFKDFLPHIKNGDKLIDIGCGNGRFYKFIKEYKQVEYTGIDNNPEFLKIAKIENKEASFTEGNLLKLSLKSDSIDVALAIASLHHIPSKRLRKDAIKEIHRVLKENGTFILTVWNLFQTKYKKYIWKARIKHGLTLGKYDPRDTLIPWGTKGVERYYYAFKPRELKKLLTQCGFSIVFSHKDRNLTVICKKNSKKSLESKLTNTPLHKPVN